jgi:hypothetical protein
MLFHVGKLVAECCDVVLGQLICDGAHEGVIHSGARSMRQYEKRCGAGRQEQQSGNLSFIQDGKSQIADFVHWGLTGFIAVCCEELF